MQNRLSLTNALHVRELNQYFNFYFRILGKELCSTLNYLYTDHFSGELYSILDQTCLISILHPRLNCMKTIVLTAAHTQIVDIWEHTCRARGGDEGGDEG